MFLPSTMSRGGRLLHRAYASRSESRRVAGRSTIRLSNYEFRTYQKRDGDLSLRLFSHLLLDTRDNGHINYFFIPVRARLTLANAAGLTLDISYPDAPVHVVGDLHVYHIWFSGRIPRKQFVPGVASLFIHYRTEYLPHHLRRYHRHLAVVKELPLKRLSAAR